MATKKSTTSTDTPTPRKARVRKAGYFLAKLTGENDPTIVIAKNYKAALAAVVQIRVATASDLIQAGKSGYLVIDSTAKTDAAESSTGAAE